MVSRIILSVRLSGKSVKVSEEQAIVTRTKLVATGESGIPGMQAGMNPRVSQSSLEEFNVRSRVMVNLCHLLGDMYV